MVISCLLSPTVSVYVPSEVISGVLITTVWNDTVGVNSAITFPLESVSFTVVPALALPVLASIEPCVDSDPKFIAIPLEPAIITVPPVITALFS